MHVSPVIIPHKFLKDFVKVNPTFTALLLNVWKFNG